MKTIKWSILSMLLMLALGVNAQTKTTSIIKITMQLDDQPGTKTYECNAVSYYKDNDKAPNSFADYDLVVSSYELSENQLLEWSSDFTKQKNVKITVYKLGKKVREYLLKNTKVKTFSESTYKTEVEDATFASYDIRLDAEEVFINGVQMKGKNDLLK